MKGVPTRSRPPPMGFDEAPTMRWKQRQKLGGDADPDLQPSSRTAPALKFLRRLRTLPEPAPAPEPARSLKSRPEPSETDTTAAQRHRLHRERVRNGRRIVPVAIDSGAEDLLRASGLLQEWDADSREAVGQAVQRLLELLVLADRHA